MQKAVLLALSCQATHTHTYILLISLFSTVSMCDNMPNADTFPILPGRPYISM